MVGKRSGKALLREEGKFWLWPSDNSKYADLCYSPGLERTDNSMDLTMWPQVGMINQKNYYT